MVADSGCIVTGSSEIQIHHAVGRTYKKDKVVIGEIFILPLWVHLHDVSSNHPLNVTHHRKAFIKEYGLESELFEQMCQRIESHDVVLPFPEIYRETIKTVNR